MKLLSKTVVIFLFFCSSRGFSNIDPNKIEIFNASRVVKPDNTQSNPNNGGTVTPTGNIKVFGGLAGTACPAGTTSTCNNCATQGNNTPCNATRISADSLLRFEFQTDNASVLTGTTNFYLKSDTTTITVTAENHSSSLSANTTLFMQIPWSQICNDLNGDPTCTNGFTNGVKSVQVGLSASADNTLDESFTIDLYLVAGSTSQYITPCPPGATSSTDSDGGYCYFEVERGDEKVYITNEAHGANFSRAPNGVEYKYLRIYYGESSGACSDGGFTAVSSASRFKDLTFTEQNGSFTLDDPTISGLKNGTTYYFRFANVDEAGNAFYFAGDSTAAGKQLLTGNLHCKVPAEVVGLLDGKECFIATAAYGTQMAPQINVLRDFRDQFLKTNSVGRWFVTQYYKYSPKWAHKIKKNDSARAAVRATLSPVISVAQWIIFHGLKSFIILSAIGFGFGFLIIRKMVRDYE